MFSYQEEGSESDDEALPVQGSPKGKGKGKNKKCKGKDKGRGKGKFNPTLVHPEIIDSMKL